MKKIYIAPVIFALGCQQSANTPASTGTSPRIDSTDNVVLKLHDSTAPTENFPATITADTCHVLMIRRWSTDPAKTSHLGFGSAFKAAVSVKSGDTADKAAFYSDKNCQSSTSVAEVTQKQVDDGILVNSAMLYLKSTVVGAKLEITVDPSPLVYAALHLTTKTVAQSTK